MAMHQLYRIPPVFVEPPPPPPLPTLSSRAPDNGGNTEKNKKTLCKKAQVQLLRM